MRHGRLLLVAWVALVLAPVGRAQEPAKPGPEHEIFKELVGTWEATVKFMGGESKGTMVYKMGPGDLWLNSKFEGDFGGQKFEGRGIDGYDPNKKKYVSVWVDSMSSSLMVSEGTYDKDTKTMTMEGEGPGMDGKPTKIKSVIQVKDKDTMVLTMYTVKDGKDQEMMTISYKRKS
jgi:hypothetical protein